MRKRGIGLGSMLYGIGFGFGRPDSASAYVEIAEDGTATLLSGCAEIGQGSSTILCQIAAEELGIRYEDVRIVSADTSVTPDAGPSTASRQTYVSGNAVRKAAADARKEVLELAAEMLVTSRDNLVVRDRMISLKDDPSIVMPFARAAAESHRRGRRFAGFGWHDITTPDVDPETNQGDAYASYLYATQLAEVEVDTDTGEVRLLRLVSATDVGRAINPSNVAGQVQGGASMGMGYALCEEVVMDRGVTLTPSLREYRVPTSMDVPNIEAIIVEEEDPSGPFGAKGVGEAAAIPTAPAILNAIYDAVGVRVSQLPATPERILGLLKGLS